MSRTPTIVWLRDDLRLDDHPALHAAASASGPVLSVFIWDPAGAGRWAPGAASRWWLHHSLADLGVRLEALGSRLLLRQGPVGATLRRLVEETGARTICFNRGHGPVAAAQEQAVTATLRGMPVDTRGFDAARLQAPDAMLNSAGRPYRVFTAFWRACLTHGKPRQPLPAVQQLMAPSKWPRSLPTAELNLLPGIAWADGLARTWMPGEGGARAALRRLVGKRLPGYPRDRNLPGVDGTSELSPHLHFGELSAARAWQVVQAATRGKRGAIAAAGAAFLRQLGWREFAQYQLHHFGYTLTQPLRPEYARFPWRSDARQLQAWQQGRTGYPIVDAGMRQLREIGWMHNRVRMIVASFLVKDLLLSWQTGAAWFWDSLVDADLANNTLGWQWVAGCGSDAAPYFRVFNPVLQGKRFDAQGAYVRRFVPELARLPDRWIHAPWQAPAAVRRAAGVRLGRTYPAPVVSHAAARLRALTAWKQLRAAARPEPD